MNQSPRFTKGRLIAFLCCSLLPLAGIGFGIMIVSTGIVFTFWVCATYFLLPLMAIGAFGWCIFSRCSTVAKVLLSILIAVLFVIVSFYLYLATPFFRISSYSGEELQGQYTTVQEDAPLMPKLEEIGDPEQIELYSCRNIAVFWEAETDHLVCRYTPNEYEKQKAMLEENYVFQTEDFTFYGDPAQCSGEVGDYVFRILSVEEYEEDMDYPTDFILIGTSDEAFEIVYMAFEDDDLDYIPSLKEFVLEDCGWRYIR